MKPIALFITSPNVKFEDILNLKVKGTNVSLVVHLGAFYDMMSVTAYDKHKGKISLEKLILLPYKNLLQSIAGISSKIVAVWPVSYSRWDVFIFFCDVHHRDHDQKYLRIDNSGWSVNSSTLFNVAGTRWYQTKYYVLYTIRQPIIDSIY